METNKQPLLSFAMPTYNFGNFIAETVKSIEDGAEILELSQFEIVILDGGSNDNTEDIVCALAGLYKNISYTKQAERGGIDRDMNAVAEMARGKYIWLFAADDLLEQGWDRCIVPLLDKGGDIFLVPPILCDIQMKTLHQKPTFQGCATGRPVEFNIQQGDGSLRNYLDKAINAEALFSYMSAIVVKTDIWRNMPVREDYFGSCWAHCARLMPLFFSETKITYLNRFLIRKRCENDSFMENGLVDRIALSVDGWDRIIREFFVDVSHRQALYNIIRKEMSILVFVYTKISSQKTCEIVRLNSLVHFLYMKRKPSLSSRINYLIYRLIPSSVILNSIIKPLLPVLIRIRRKMRPIL